jgi:hypothetical protein
VEVLIFGEVAAEEEGCGVDDGEAAVAFSADGVVPEGLALVRESMRGGYCFGRCVSYLFEPV